MDLLVLKHFGITIITTMITLKQIILEVTEKVYNTPVERSLIKALTTIRLGGIKSMKTPISGIPESISPQRLKKFAQNIHQMHMEQTGGKTTWKTLKNHERDVYRHHAISALSATYRALLEDPPSEDGNIIGQEAFERAHGEYAKEIAHKPLEVETPADISPGDPTPGQILSRAIIIHADRLLKDRKPRKSSKDTPLESLGEQN